MKKIIVLGLHNSGSTVLCSMMQFLGIHFGCTGGLGRYGLNYEFGRIGRVMQKYMRFGQPIDWNEIAKCGGELTHLLWEFFNRWSPMDCAIKHPFLCAGLTAVDESVIKDFMFIDCVRSLENSVKGAKWAYPKFAETMEEYQRNMESGKTTVMERAVEAGCPIFRWDYDEMGVRGRDLLEEVYQFLGTDVPSEFFEKSLSLYDESKRHFGNGVERPESDPVPFRQERRPML